MEYKRFSGKKDNVSAMQKAGCKNIRLSGIKYICHAVAPRLLRNQPLQGLKRAVRKYITAFGGVNEQ